MVRHSLIKSDFGGVGLFAQALDRFTAREEQAVVTVPGFDIVMEPELRTDKIKQPIAAGAETLPPEFIVLLVNMKDAALSGNGSGKQDSVGMCA